MSEDIMSSVKDMDDEQLEALKQCIRDAEQARKAEEVSEAVDDGEKNDTEEPVGEDIHSAEPLVGGISWYSLICFLLSAALSAWEFWWKGRNQE